MKRLLAYLIIVLGFEIFIQNKSFAIEFGQGELKLNDYSVKGFIKFVRGSGKEYPYIFSIAEDGKAYGYFICEAGQGKCRAGNHKLVNKYCLKNSKKYGSGAKCHVLAHVRTIRWDNGINKKTKFKSKWSDDEIIAKLTELGFYGNTSSTTTQTIEKKKKTTQTSTTKEAKKNISKVDLDGFMNALEKAKNAGLTIDADTTAKQFGYKNFEEFFMHFKSENDIEELTIEEAKEFLLGADNTIDIVESQENLDKLYELIMNHKKFKKKTKYFKTFKKGKTKKGKVLDQMALAVYINYEKEMSKISQNPNLDETTRFAWGWGWSRGSNYTPFKWALKSCEDDAKKYKLSGGECIIVDHRTKNPEKVYNYLKPRLKDKKKKKTLVTQKKIKIKKKSLDNDPPVIDIKDTFIVKSSDFEINGKVSDKGSKLVYVKVAGQDIPVNNGKFKIKKYSPSDTEIKITAIDEWGNEATKLVKIKVKKEENIVKKLEPLNPLAIKSKINDNKLALIIGIENYSDLVKASYANNDAQYFKDYAKNILGIKNENINLLVDEDATFIKINKVLKIWLKSKVIPNKTELIIFYAGHGLANQDGDKQDLYLLPQNADTDLLTISSISRNNLFKEIINLEPKSVTIFFDACYSGISRDNKSLIASARPVNILKKVEDNIPENFTIFSASQLNQMSSGLKNGEHGIFSYYLMKGLEGLADQNKDKKITNGELQAYMSLNVSQRAAEWGRQQNPSLAGDPDKVLMSYR
jgi:hypothetical protein